MPSQPTQGVCAWFVHLHVVSEINSTATVLMSIDGISTFDLLSGERSSGGGSLREKEESKPTFSTRGRLSNADCIES